MPILKQKEEEEEEKKTNRFWIFPPFQSQEDPVIFQYATFD